MASTDGRVARSHRTRAAVVDALAALIAAGEPEPGARRIAEAAGVSVRTVFAHFAGLDDLHQALVERVRDQVLERLRPIDPSAPLDERVGELCRQRARIAEELGAHRRAAAARAAASAPLAAAREASALASKAQVERVFAAELAAFTPAERARRVAAVDAAVSGEAWDLLRGVHGLSVESATRAMATTVAAVLAGPAPEAAPGWRAEAAAVLADAEARIADLRSRVEG